MTGLLKQIPFLSWTFEVFNICIMINLQVQRIFPKGQTTQKHFKFQPLGKEKSGSFSFGAYALRRILNIGRHSVECSAEEWMAERTQSQTFGQYILTMSKVQLQLRDDTRPSIYRSWIFQESFVPCFAWAKSLFTEPWSTSNLPSQGTLWVFSFS